jgi:WD40 repeat protein
LVDALRWESQGRDRSLLLRGRDLKSAEAWIARQAERTEPRPTQLQSEFLHESRAWETRRTQYIAGGVAVALAVAIVLGIVALLQRNTARTQAAIARSRELAVSSASQLSVDPERSVLLALEAVKARRTADANNALRRAVFANRLRAAVPTTSKEIGALVNAVTFSPDGKFVAAASNDGTISIARASKNARAVALPVARTSLVNVCAASTGGAGTQRQVVFGSDGRVVAAANDRGWMQLWQWPTPRKPVTSRFCLDRTTPPSSVDLLSTITGKASFPFRALRLVGTTSVEAVRRDGRLLRWSGRPSANAQLFPLAPSPVDAAAFAASGTRVAYADRRGLGVSVPGSGVLATLRAPRAQFVATNADGTRVAAADDHSITIWTPGATGPLVVLDLDERIRSLAMSRDGNWVATGDDGHAVRVWDASGREEPVVLPGSLGSVTAVAFSSDGKRVVSAGDDAVLRVWSWESSASPSLGGSAVPQAQRFVVTDDGRVAAVAGNTLRIPTPRGVQAFLGVLNPGSVAVSRDGTRAAAADAPALADALQLWDLARSPQPQRVASQERVDAVALSPDGRWLASADFHGMRVGRWPGRTMRALDPSRITYTAAGFDAEANRVAGAAYDGKNSSISIWELPSGERATTFPALGFISRVVFSHDGTHLLAASSDGSVRVWALSGTRTPVVLRGHSGQVNDAAFSPDDEEIVTGGHDKTVRLWELAEDGKSVVLPGPGGAVQQVAFTLGGRGIVAVGVQGARVWPCEFCGPVDRVVDAARRTTTRTLTDDERALFLHAS